MDLTRRISSGSRTDSEAEGCGDSSVRGQRVAVVASPSWRGEFSVTPPISRFHWRFEASVPVGDWISAARGAAPA